NAVEQRTQDSRCLGRDLAEPPRATLDAKPQLRRLAGQSAGFELARRRPLPEPGSRASSAFGVRQWVPRRAKAVHPHPQKNRRRPTVVTKLLWFQILTNERDVAHATPRSSALALRAPLARLATTPTH